MSVVKIIEVIAQSDKGWEDAAQVAVNEASKSVRNMRSLYIENMQAKIEGTKITSFKIDAKISFVVE